MGKVNLTSNMIRAREMMVVMLAFIAAGPSFWYPMNGDQSHEFSLCRMLGFFSIVEYYAFFVAAGLAGYTGPKGVDGRNQLEFYADEWKDVLNNVPHKLSTSTAEHSVKDFDMEGLIASGKQNSKECRYYYHLLRLGSRDSESYTSTITKQTLNNGKLDTKPPLLPSLRSMQRSFKRNTQQMIADVIIENEDMYGDATNERIRTKALPERNDFEDRMNIETTSQQVSPPKNTQRTVAETSNDIVDLSTQENGQIPRQNLKSLQM